MTCLCRHVHKVITHPAERATARLPCDPSDTQWMVCETDVLDMPGYSPWSL